MVSMSIELILHRNIVVIKTDVASWNDVLAAFELGFTVFGAIDAVISNAGVNSGETLLNFETDERTQQLPPPNLDSLNINLTAHLYVTRCAVFYFRKSNTSIGSIVLTTSAAAFLDTPPMYIYSAAKSGLVGLMRSLRTDLAKEKFTVNTIAPWMTGKSRQFSSIVISDFFPSVSHGSSRTEGSLGQFAREY